MDKQFNLDYGFINKFNEESENGQRLMVEQLANLPKRSDDQHFQKIVVSHFLIQMICKQNQVRLKHY